MCVLKEKVLVYMGINIEFVINCILLYSLLGRGRMGGLIFFNCVCNGV